MNDMAYLCEPAVTEAGSLAKTDIRSLNDDVPLLVEVQRWPQRVQAAA